jgi:TPR repeat protein
MTSVNPGRISRWYSWSRNALIAGLPTIAFGIVSYLFSTTTKEWIDQQMRSTLFEWKEPLAVRQYKDAFDLIVDVDEKLRRGEGRDSAAKYRTAITKLDLPVSKKIPAAVHLLGVLYCDGRGQFLPRKPVEGMMLIRQAAELGDPAAKHDASQKQCE